MRKLLFIIVLFFSTSVLAEDNWLYINSMTLTKTLADRDFKIIDTFHNEGLPSVSYLLWNSRRGTTVMCSVQFKTIRLQVPIETKCFLEGVKKN